LETGNKSSFSGTTAEDFSVEWLFYISNWGKSDVCRRWFEAILLAAARKIDGFNLLAYLSNW